jgi:hypothetical protein
VPLSGDPGLQPQRTGLAWQRTALAAATLSLGLIALALHQHEPLAFAVGVCCAGLAATAAVLVVPTSVRHLGHSVSSPWVRLTSVVAATLLLALGGAVTALLSLRAHR